jgi:hypothetical protein
LVSVQRTRYLYFRLNSPGWRQNPLTSLLSKVSLFIRAPLPASGP